MNLLEAFEELNLLNESTDLTEAKSASDLRPIRKANFDAWQPMYAKQSKLVSDLNSILEGKVVKNFETGEAGTMDVFGKEENIHITAMEIVARIHAIRVLTDKSRYLHHKYNYILADSTNPSAKDYTIALRELAAVIQPEPTDQAVWQDITFKVRFKQRVLWDGSQKSELADYWSRYIKTANTAKDTAKIYVLDSTAAAKANAAIKDFNNEISAAVLQSDYWTTYKSNWLAEQQAASASILRSKIQAIINNWGNATEEEKELVINNKTAHAKQTFTANTANNTQSVGALISKEGLAYTIGWLASHTSTLNISLPYTLENWVKSKLGAVPGYDDFVYIVTKDAFERARDNNTFAQFGVAMSLTANAKDITTIPPMLAAIPGYKEKTRTIEINNTYFLWDLITTYNFRFAHAGVKQDKIKIRSCFTSPEDLNDFDAGYNAA